MATLTLLDELRTTILLGRPCVAAIFPCVYTDEDIQGIDIKIDQHIDGKKGGHTGPPQQLIRSVS